MIGFIIALWVATFAAVVIVVWRLATVTAYRGRHRTGRNPSTSEWMAELAGPDPLALFVDVLTMPVHTCALPPVPAPAAYGALGPPRLMAARDSMRRRTRALRPVRELAGVSR